MVEIKEIGDVTVGILEIPTGGPLSRRQRERKAVQEILHALFQRPMELEHNADGAPIIDGTPISITHSQRLAVVAVNLKNDKPIGIDAEEYRQALQRVKTRFLSSEELQWITSDNDLLRAWTVKEAVYKAAGLRLLTGPEIRIAPNWEQAMVGDQAYRLTTLHIDETLITLALPC